MNNNHKAHKFEKINEQNTSFRTEPMRERRHALADTSTVSTNTNTSGQNQCYYQLAERVRELEKEIAPDLRFYQLPPNYSPFSAITPCSNISGAGFSNYSHPQNFPINLLSPNSSVPTHPCGLSSKVIERAHLIPERFWIQWQEKQMQNRIEELEYIKNSLTSPSNEVNLGTTNRRKSLLLLHNAQRRVSFPRSTNNYKTVSTSIGSETPSSNIDNHNSFSFDQRSIDDADIDNLNDLNISSPKEPTTPIQCVRKPHSTLDRSRLSIFLPFSNTNLLEQTMLTNNLTKSISEKPNDIKNNLNQTNSSENNIDDVAQIATEFNFTLLLRERKGRTSPLVYSKSIINRTIKFGSSSKNDPLIYQNETSSDEEMVI